jgi:hypothetical protein
MTSKPGIDHLEVGDEVVVIERIHRSEDRLTPVRITKINRVWWEFEEIQSPVILNRAPRTWRMRKATQYEGDYRGDYYGDRFVTAEQLLWEDQDNTARRYLREIGLDAGKCTVIDRLTLANLIRTHLGMEEIQ